MSRRHRAIFINMVACNSTTSGVGGCKFPNVFLIGGTHCRSVAVRTDRIARGGRVSQRNGRIAASGTHDRYRKIFRVNVVQIVESALQSIVIGSVGSYISPCIDNSGCCR